MVLAIGTAAYDLYFPLAGWLEENRKYEIPASQESGGGPAANAAYLLSLWEVPAAWPARWATTCTAGASWRSSARWGPTFA
jgi:sugar/nucleoside kinase (ribokinase family)